MIRMLLGANGTILRSIVTKWITKILRKYGLNTNIKCGDFVVYKENEDLIIHLNADMKVSEKELLAFLNDRLDA